MNSCDFIIRPAAICDVEAMLDIYEPYITDTTVTFEYAVPSIEEFQSRFERISGVYPYLVAESDGRIIGYAYADVPFSTRAAYAWDVDVSIYLDSEFTSKGVGSALYKALHSILIIAGYKNSYAFITGENQKSVSFHESFGYKLSGVIKKTGYKLGRWSDVIIMEYELSAKNSDPSLPLPFSSLDPSTVGEICKNQKDNHII